MKITAVEKGMKSTDRYNIYIDGSFSFAVYIDTLSKFNLTVDREIDDFLITEIIELDKTLHAKKLSFNILSRSNLTKSMLCDKLRQKNIDEKYIMAAAEYLIEKDYINDERFAADKAKYMFETKKCGVDKIRGDLIYKYGIDRELAENTAADLSDSISKENLYFLMSREKGKKDYSDRKTVSNLMNKFRSKGYSYDDIKSVIYAISNGEEL